MRSTKSRNYVERIALVVNGGFRIGTVDEIMTVGVLSEMYRIPVDVDNRTATVSSWPDARGQSLPVSDV